LFWTVELLACGLVAGFMIRYQTGQPFCNRCRSWKEERRLGDLKTNKTSAVEAVTRGEIVRLAVPETGSDQLRFTVAVCPTCGGEADIDVTLAEVTYNEKNEESVTSLTNVTYPGEALRILESLFPSEKPGQAGTADGTPESQGRARSEDASTADAASRESDASPPRG
jgi:hypothetical protein